MKTWKHCTFAGIMAIVLVFGMTVVGFNSCSKNVDRRLNGTWKFVRDANIVKYNSGNWEFSTEDGTPVVQGTYTTSDGKLESTATHLYGGDARWHSINEVGPDYYVIINYTINDNTLTLTDDQEHQQTYTRVNRNGKFTKATNSGEKSASAGRSISRIRERDLIGVWELEDVVNIPRREVSDKDEFFKDGTGITSKGSQSMSFTWRLRDGNRLQMDASSGTQISDIELSDNGKLLTYYLDDGHQKKAMYRKK